MRTLVQNEFYCYYRIAVIPENKATKKTQCGSGTCTVVRYQRVYWNPTHKNSPCSRLVTSGCTALFKSVSSIWIDGIGLNAIASHHQWFNTLAII